MIHLNDDPDLNKKIVRFWRRGEFRRFIEREHPVVRLKRKDITTLEESLNRLFDIYYLAVTNPRSPPEPATLFSLIKRNLCTPLSNYEIRFMMNSSVENAFPRLPLTMLMISSHELLIGKKGTPVYPKVHSAYLRKTLKLPPLLPLEKANLFATKNEDKVYSGIKAGFIYCRKISH